MTNIGLWDRKNNKRYIFALKIVPNRLAFIFSHRFNSKDKQILSENSVITYIVIETKTDISRP